MDRRLGAKQCCRNWVSGEAAELILQLLHWLVLEGASNEQRKHNNINDIDKLCAIMVIMILSEYYF
jgi:hypothetical protein